MMTTIVIMRMPLRPICSGGSQLQWRKQTDGRQVVAGRSIVGFLKPQKPQKYCHTDTSLTLFRSLTCCWKAARVYRDSRTENWSWLSRSKTSLSDFPPTKLLSPCSSLWVRFHTTYELHRTNLELSLNVPGALFQLWDWLSILSLILMSF